MKHLTTFLLTAMVALSAWAQAPKTPSVEFRNFTQPEPTTIDFDVAVLADCNRYIYVNADSSLFTLAESFGMTVSQFIETLTSYGLEWVDAEPGQVDHYHFSDFEPNSNYVTFILAKNAAGESTVVSHPFSTGATGGEGEAQLAMTVTHPSDSKVHIDIDINDQTAYYWYTTLDDQLLGNWGTSIATATTDDYLRIMDELVNTHEMSYFIHTADLSEDFEVGVNIETGVQYVAVAFPFNANDSLGSFTQPIVFSAEGQSALLGADDIALAIWPNPASETAHIGANTPLRSVEIYDLQGRRVVHLLPNSERADIPVAQLPRGAYIVKVRTDKGMSVQRLIR